VRDVYAVAVSLVACLATARAAGAQAPDPSAQETPDLVQQLPYPIVSFGSMPVRFNGQQSAGSVNSTEARRACAGCPPRRIGMSLLQTTGINVFYGLANLARGQVTGRITPKTWWANMQQGWVWDLDDFTVNQIGHPYQGSNYFNAGRANGLSFYESAAVTAFGSGTWEFFGETNHASLNDFINTTLGGITLGEMLHRAGWLVRNTHATGKRRLWREIGATAIDPITGLNRFASGDASRVTDKPSDLVPSSLSGVASAGRLGLQLFAMQHVGALGDLQTVNGSVADVTANFWSLGAAIVIR
jgi:hypothetical protein